jgi:ribose-phosphate pyrophosphokinase
MSVTLVGYPDIKIINFSAGEGHVELSKEAIHNIKSDYGPTLIRCDYTSDSDLFHVAFLVDAIREVKSSPRIHLLIPYFPYARQDRVTTYGSAFSLKVATRFINSLKLDKVFIQDPHSVVLPTLLDNHEILTNRYDVIDKLVRGNVNRDKFVVVAPDAGAVKRSKFIAEKFDLRFAIADKKRDPSTGKILSTEIFGKLQDGDHIIVVDDICDGGRTFIELAKSIRKENDVSMHLFVTFGIFSKGKGVLYEHFETVEAEYEFWSK